MNGIIRKTKSSDIDAVFKIEKSQSGTWKREYFEDEVFNSLSYFYVIEDYISKDIIGFIIFWIIDEIAELHSISTDDDYKRQGYAKKMINHMFDILRNKKIREVFLEVRKSNIPAINLYKQLEFNKISERKEYYRSPVEDALIFRKSIY